jgi:glucose-6-phosphate isomerase
MLLRFDTRSLYADAVGPEGVSPEDLKSVTAAVEQAHRFVLERTRAGLDSEYACLTLPQTMEASVGLIEAEAERLRDYPDVLVIGIGGSNLGAMAAVQALAHGNRKAAGSRLHFIDNIDPDYLHDLLNGLSPESTGVVVISKSGGTIETATQYLIVRQWLRAALGEAARAHQWIVTDPVSGWLRTLAKTENLRDLPVPPKVGGRYSVLTAVGLLPLAVAGIDVRALLAGARANAERCASGTLAENPALELATLYYLLDTRHQKRLSIFMPYVHSLRLFGDWYRQLWAESLGKHGADGMPAGTLPVTAVGAVDQHSQLQMYLESRRDKIFNFLALQQWTHDDAIPLSDADNAAFPYLAGKTLGQVLVAEFQATRQVITQYGHPNLTIELPALNAHTLGQLIDLYQRTTIYAGLLYGVNPLDQPAVETGKRLTLKLLQGEKRP